MEDTLRSYGVQERISEAETVEVPEEAARFFGIRYNLEREIGRIWQVVSGESGEQRFTPIARITNSLVRSEMLDPELALVAREVYSICSVAVHGEEVSTRQRDFVEKNASELLSSLRAIRVRITDHA